MECGESDVGEVEGGREIWRWWLLGWLLLPVLSLYEWDRGLLVRFVVSAVMTCV